MLTYSIAGVLTRYLYEQGCGLRHAGLLPGSAVPYLSTCPLISTFSDFPSIPLFVQTVVVSAVDSRHWIKNNSVSTLAIFLLFFLNCFQCGI